jgi:GTPase
VLAEIGAGELPQLQVFNKIDKLQIPPALERSADGAVNRVWISAAADQGLELLVDGIAERLNQRVRRVQLQLPPSAGALRARLYAEGAVRAEGSSADGIVQLTVELPDAELQRLRAQPGITVAACEAPACEA